MKILNGNESLVDAIKISLKNDLMPLRQNEKKMHRALWKPCTRGLLVQPGKDVIGQLARTYADKADHIKLPPEPTTCCMSGCANCVWIQYAQTVSKLLDGNDEKVREIILNNISDPNLKMFLTVEFRHLHQQKQNNDKK